MSLEEIAKKMSEMTNIMQQVAFLQSLGREQHIQFETGESSRLAEENPERFMKIGSKTIDKSKYEKSDEEYVNSCISNAKYLYERYPIIFEFYDELVNGILQEENTQKKGL